MITLAGLSFVVSLSTENKAVHRQGDQLRLDEALASGAELLKAFCDQSSQAREESGGTHDNAAAFGSREMPGIGDTQTIAQVSIVSPDIESRAPDGERFGLQNESARLNLAVLADWERTEPGQGLAALMHLPGMSESAAAAILDWIDADGEPRPGGAEAEYYAGRGLPYEPRNGVPALLEELLLVRDVSRLSLLGDEGRSGSFAGPSASEATRVVASAGRESDQPWADLLTTYSAERNTTFDGKPRIYLNEADLRKLHGQLTETLEQPWADFIVAFRQFGPSDQAGAPPVAKPRRGGMRNARSRALQPPSHRRSEPPPLDLSLPAKYSIECVLDLVAATVALPREPITDEAEPPPVVPSPLEDDPQRIREELPRLADLTATTDQTTIYGRVNINEAPRCVLLGLPGLEPAVVDRILALRDTVAEPSDLGRRHALWLLTEGLVDRPTMKALWPHVTGGGDVFRAHVVARTDDEQRTTLAEVVIDATVSPPRQVYWKRLAW
jgi:hypothetical protein